MTIESLLAMSAPDFVQAAYRHLLDRSADEKGRQFYLRLIRDGRSKRSVLFDLAASPEYKCKRSFATINGSDEHFVRSVFRALLNREADTEGLRHYTNMLARGTSREAVVNDIERSFEYKNLRTAEAQFNRDLDDLVASEKRHRSWWGRFSVGRYERALNALEFRLEQSLRDAVLSSELRTVSTLAECRSHLEATIKHLARPQATTPVPRSEPVLATRPSVDEPISGTSHLEFEKASFRNRLVAVAQERTAQASRSREPACKHTG